MPKLQTLALLALGIAVTCGSASAAYRPAVYSKAAAHKKLTPPLQIVGVSDNTGMYDSPDPDQPAGFIQKAKNVGFNAERVYIRWDPFAPTPTSDQMRQLCNAATQAALNQVSNFILTVPPPRWAQPLDDDTRQPFMYTWQRYFSDLFDPSYGCVSGNAVIAGQAVPKLSRIYVEPLNEMNLETFCRPQTDTSHDLCASLAVQMRAYVYAQFKLLGQQYGVQVIIIGGALSSHHDPLGYMQSECNAMKSLGITSPNMDVFGFHPYSLPGSSNPLSGFLMLPKLKKLIMQCYGQDLPIIYDEYGAETVTPGDLGYTCSAPDSGALVMSDTQRAWIYQLALDSARKQGVIGILFFLLQDEQCLNPGWQSGFYYWNGLPKPNLSDIRQAVARALAP